MNIYRIVEEKPVSEEEILKSGHYVKFAVDPIKGEEKLFTSLGKDINTEDLIYAVSLMTTAIYHGLESVDELSEQADLFRQTMQRLFASEAFWSDGKKDYSDKN